MTRTGHRIAKRKLVIALASASVTTTERDERGAATSSIAMAAADLVSAPQPHVVAAE